MTKDSIDNLQQIKKMYDVMGLHEESVVLELCSGKCDCQRKVSVCGEYVQYPIDIIESRKDNEHHNYDVQSQLFGRCDVVIIHGFKKKDINKASLNIKKYLLHVLENVKKFLKPGGKLALSVTNKYELKNLKKLLVLRGILTSYKNKLSIWECRTAIKHIQFSQVSIFNIIPEIDAPKWLISFDKRASQNYFSKQLVLSKEYSSVLGLMIRYFILKLNLNKYIENAFLIVVIK